MTQVQTPELREVLAGAAVDLGKLSNEEYQALFLAEYPDLAPDAQEMVAAALRSLLARDVAHIEDGLVRFSGVALAVRQAVLFGKATVVILGVAETSLPLSLIALPSGEILVERLESWGLRSYTLDVLGRVCDKVCDGFNVDSKPREFILRGGGRRSPSQKELRISRHADGQLTMRQQSGDDSPGHIAFDRKVLVDFLEGCLRGEG